MKEIIRKIYSNYKMISPFPAFWWLAIGFVAQLIYPLTKLNIDNTSLTTLQFGVASAAVLAMASMWLSFLWEKKPNESIFLNFLYSSSKQFVDLAMAVAGFSSAYFLLHSVYWLTFILLFGSIVLATSFNHIYLVVFNESEVGTYRWALSLDEKRSKVWNSYGVKVVAGLSALVAMVLLGCVVTGWLKV
ncbi:hypothetical protein K9B43_03455 [Pseudomonas sp. S5(2021)]|nr:hypothetical protein [Pseudomonas sp. S5(2021)]